MTYFDLLSMPQKYDFDLQILEQQYFSALNKFHPDRAKTESEKTNFLVSSMEINNAYKALKDELGRAKYLLLIRGVDIDDVNIKNKFPAQNLAKIWEDFEFIDDNDNVQELRSLKNQKLVEKQNIIAKLTSSFTAEDISAATVDTLMLRYITNIIENINLKMKDVTN